ncbi:MAG: Rho termination factor N-terminal domain-containing protein [Clostridium sp.]|nr:MAG: Rho termination factor N-terminal domain-containing protein [Clostridium sp.]
MTKESKEVKEVAAKVEKKVEEAVDYAKLTVAELKSLCKREKGIEVLSTMKKNDLVEALKK